MWTLRSAAHHVAPTFIFLISMIIVGGAHAQTAADASDGKRVEVLQTQAASATNEGSVKKSKTATTAAKKKVVQRKTNKQTKAVANEGAPNPNTPLQPAVAVPAPAMPAQNDTPTLSTEQAGTLAVGDRAVALASSPGEDNNVGLSTANYVGTKEDPSAGALAMGNSPRAVADTEQSTGAQLVGRQVPSSRNSRLSQALATLSGAMAAAVFGWYLISSSRRRISLGVGT
jgi:hypothetical protein